MTRRSSPQQNQIAKMRTLTDTSSYNELLCSYDPSSKAPPTQGHADIFTNAFHFLLLLDQECPFTPSSAFFSSTSKSTFFALKLPPPNVVELSLLGVVGACSPWPLGLFGEPASPRFNLSRASNSASEKFRACLGLKGTGVDTLLVKNYFTHKYQ